MKFDWRGLVALFMLLFAGGYVHFFSSVEQVPPKRPFSQFPAGIGQWRLVQEIKIDERTMKNLRVNDYLFRRYSDGVTTVEVYVGYYRSQRAGAQIHSPRHCLPGSGWYRISEGTASMDLGRGDSLHYVRAVYAKNEEKTLYFYWYDVQGRTLTSQYFVKASMIYNSLFHRRSDGALIRVSTSLNGGNLAESRLKVFLRLFVPLIREYLP